MKTWEEFKKEHPLSKEDEREVDFAVKKAVREHLESEKYGLGKSIVEMGKEQEQLTKF